MHIWADVDCRTLNKFDFVASHRLRSIQKYVCVMCVYGRCALASPYWYGPFCFPLLYMCDTRFCFVCVTCTTIKFTNNFFFFFLLYFYYYYFCLAKAIRYNVCHSGRKTCTIYLFNSYFVFFSRMWQN